MTDAGQRLRRIYSEKDLLVAECIRTDLWRRLDPAELAAVVSTLVHEPRGEPSDLSPRLPTAAVDEAWEEIEDTLLMADLGTKTTLAVVDDLRGRIATQGVSSEAEARAMLRAALIDA